MIRRVTLVKRADGLTLSQFLDHWRTTHAELITQLEGLRGYRISLLSGAASDWDWDGMAEGWFDSVEAAKSALSAEPLASRIREDVPRLASRTVTFFLGETHTIVAPPVS